MTPTAITSLVHRDLYSLQVALQGLRRALVALGAAPTGPASNEAVPLPSYILWDSPPAAVEEFLVAYN